MYSGSCNSWSVSVKAIGYSAGLHTSAASWSQLDAADHPGGSARDSWNRPGLSDSNTLYSDDIDDNQLDGSINGWSMLVVDNAEFSAGPSTTFVDP